MKKFFNMLKWIYLLVLPICMTVAAVGLTITICIPPGLDMLHKWMVGQYISATQFAGFAIATIVLWTISILMWINTLVIFVWKYISKKKMIKKLN